MTYKTNVLTILLTKTQTTMKTKLLTILTLLVLCVTGAWAADFVDKWTGINVADGREYVTQVTLGKGASFSSNRIANATNGGTAKFTVSMRPSGYTIKSIKFFMNQADANTSSFTSSKGTVENTSTQEWTFTPSVSDDEIDFTLVNASGKQQQISQMWVTFSDNNSDANYESLIPTGATSGTINCTSTGATSYATITSTASTGSGGNVTYVNIGQNGTLTVTATKNIKYILFSWYNRCPTADGDWSPSTGAFSYSNYKWTPADSETKTVTFTRTPKNSAGLTNIHIVYQPEGAQAPTFNPATASEIASESSVDITSANATSVKYKWTNSSATPADGWSSATADANGKITVTAPEYDSETPANNTVYLHAQGFKGETGGTAGYAQYTITAPDLTAPALESTTPANNAKKVARSGDITLTFDEAVVCTTNATLTPAGGNPVELTPSVSGETITYSYDGLDYYTAYTFALAANSVEDASGNALTDAINITFRTEDVALDPAAYVENKALINYPTSSAGITVSGTSTTATVKIHENTDQVNCLAIKNGFVTDSKVNENKIVLSVDGGFKVGDKITIAGVINNSNAAKDGAASIFVGETGSIATTLFTTSNFINAYTATGDPEPESYILTDNYDKLYVGRSNSLSNPTQTNITLLKVERSGYNIPVTSAGYATLYASDKSLDFTDATAVEAYIVTDITAEGTKIKKVTKVPAATPLLVKSVSGSGVQEVVAVSPAITENVDNNMLKANGVTGDESTVYILGAKDGVAVWGLLRSGAELAAGKVYLKSDAPLSKEYLSIIIGDDDETTAIDHVSTPRFESNAPMYNLTGQKVSESYKGIVIVNGKKYMNK